MAGYCPAHADAGIATSGRRPHAPARGCRVACAGAGGDPVPARCSACRLVRQAHQHGREGGQPRGCAATLEKAALHVKSLPAKTDGDRAGGAGHPGGPLALRQQGGRDLHRRHAGRDEARGLGAASGSQGGRAAVALRHRRHHLQLPRGAQGAAARPPTCLSSTARRAIASCAGPTARSSACSPRCAPTSSWRWATGGCSRRPSGSWRARSTRPACACWRWSRAARRRCTAWPRIDKASKRAAVDVIDPAQPAGCHGLRARPDAADHGPHRRATCSYVQPSSGPERSLLLQGSVQGGRRGRRQPHRAARRHRRRASRAGATGCGRRSRSRASTRRCSSARMADFLNALGAPNRRLAAVAPAGRQARRARPERRPDDLPAAACGPAGRRPLLRASSPTSRAGSSPPACRPTCAAPSVSRSSTSASCRASRRRCRSAISR